jgi:hypothetical protein
MRLVTLIVVLFVLAILILPEEGLRHAGARVPNVFLDAIMRKCDKEIVACLSRRDYRPELLSQSRAELLRLVGEDGDAGIRARSILILGLSDSGSRDVVTALISSSSSIDVNVRKATAISLHHPAVTDSRAFACLGRLVVDADALVAAEAQISLEKVASMRKQQEEAIWESGAKRERTIRSVDISSVDSASQYDSDIRRYRRNSLM